jgi:hypothetical protein
LLEHYPELEEVLIGIAPPFKKLKNPLLRRSVAKIASLRQVAAVGGLPVLELVNRLREAVGQALLTDDDQVEDAAYLAERPPWFDPEHIVDTFDTRTDPDEDTITIARLLPRAAHLAPGELAELVSTFLPAPGIDVLRGKGYRVWTVREGPDLFHTYVAGREVES